MSNKSLKFFCLILLFGFIIFSCATKKTATTVDSDKSKSKEKIERIIADTIDVFPDQEMGEDNHEDEEEPKQEIYNPSAKRSFDLIHTKLDLNFDWTKQHVIGKAELTLAPLFYEQNKLILDAKGFDIKAIKNKTTNTDLKYSYDAKQVTIDLDRKYKRKEQFVIWMDYVAKPNEGPEAGSAAITSDKGLFFINPLGDDKNKPQQIWTQGETENNSRWFPTFDKPNERCTQEITVTIEDRFKTLSNGLLISSKKNTNGTRTDTWKQDKPHAPYLFMLAIGEYAEVKDMWKDIPLSYLVEPKYEPHAKKIFNHTPEMLEYFSKILDYKYPWDKYAQVITRDYVSGAMENTSAVIFGEFVQKTEREMIDNDNDAIVAHEMFHHWFGDLVTCESWSNLTLNEGFANYSEYLWYENKYGVDRADEHRANEIAGYLSETSGGKRHPLIHYGYDNKEDMFDAHSYNKGGLVLHMLRKYVGDEAFFAALNYYLVQNKYTAVEVDELRMAFEDVVGEDLNWFFNQWYLTDGHPEIDFRYEHNSENNNLIAYINQKQYPNFKLNFDLAIYDQDGKIQYHNIWSERQNDTIIIKNVPKPSAVVLDGKDDVLAEISSADSLEDLYIIAQHAPNINQRSDAFSRISYKEQEDYSKLIELGMNEKKSRSMIITAISALDESNLDKYTARLKDLAVNASHSETRGAALSKLGENLKIEKDLVLQILEKEKAYPVLSSALIALSNIDIDLAKKKAAEYEKSEGDAMLEGIGYIYAIDNDLSKASWFIDKIKTGDVAKTYSIYGGIAKLIASNPQKDAENIAIIDQLFEIATKDVNKYKRYLSAMTIASLKGQSEEEGAPISAKLLAKVTSSINEIKKQEKDSELIELYKSRF
jgi:aminopeptidase N